MKIQDKKLAISLTANVLLVMLVLFSFYWLRPVKPAPQDPGMADTLQYYQLVADANQLLLEGKLADAERLFIQADALRPGAHWSELARRHSSKQQLHLDSLQRMRATRGAYLDKNKHLVELNNLLLAKIDEKNEDIDSLKNQLIETYSILHASDINLIALEKEIYKVKSTHRKMTVVNKAGVKISYYGEVAEETANGYGIGIFETKGIYEGNWQNNLRHGFGTYHWKNGDVYEGDFVENQREGYGTYTFASGEKYVGNWKADLREGKGTVYSKEGDIMVEGYWERDKFLKNKQSANIKLER
jgi:hypothetical protein